ncbi:hypothetical protein LCGC14_1861010 [marine sediment metagenome]|uniref:Uncharacterized protein n=1 Tax=marine sediment metagenome TaxID=412755 RepID=A0A0F9G7Z6_9ZZZZ
MAKKSQEFNERLKQRLAPKPNTLQRLKEAARRLRR